MTSVMTNVSINQSHDSAYYNHDPGKITPARYIFTLQTITTIIIIIVYNSSIIAQQKQNAHVNKIITFSNVCVFFHWLTYI